MAISLAPDAASTPQAPLAATKPKPLTGLAPTSGTAPATPGIPAPTIAAPSAPVDRVKLATDVFNTSAASTEGAYNAATRSTAQQAAGLGQVASGGLRTSEGNLQLARSRDLDQMRAKLVNDATTGSIADATTAYQQQLASSQQGLAAELGRGNLGLATKAQEEGNALSVGGLTGSYAAPGGETATPTLANRSLSIEQQNADTATAAQRSEAALGQGRLNLATGEATGSVNGQQTLSAQQLAQQNAIATAGLTGVLNGADTLQAKQQAVNEAVARGQLTVEQGRLALAQLANSQQNTLASGQLDLARLSQADQTAIAHAGLDISKMSAETAQKAQAATEAYNQGQLSLAGRDQALRELANSQQNTLATGQLDLAKTAQADQNALVTGQLDLAKITASDENRVRQQNADTAQAAEQSSATNQAGQLQLAKDQLAQAGTQFGLSLAQQKDLATLADQTQNRQIDVSTAQGQNALLLQLAQIIGGPSGNLDPNFVQTIMKALGLAGAATSGGTAGGTTGGTTQTGGTAGGGTTGTGGREGEV